MTPARTDNPGSPPPHTPAVHRRPPSTEPGRLAVSEAWLHMPLRPRERVILDRIAYRCRYDASTGRQTGWCMLTDAALGGSAARRRATSSALAALRARGLIVVKQDGRQRVIRLTERVRELLLQVENDRHPEARTDENDRLDPAPATSKSSAAAENVRPDDLDEDEDEDDPAAWQSAAAPAGPMDLDPDTAAEMERLAAEEPDPTPDLDTLIALQDKDPAEDEEPALELRYVREDEAPPAAAPAPCSRTRPAARAIVGAMLTRHPRRGA